MLTQSQRLTIIFSGVSVLLLIPFIAMQFSPQVFWTPSDFIIMGVLLLITGLGCDLILQRVRHIKHRLVLCGAILMGFLLIWAELAVGVFGTPFAGS